ncbi:hypothetical protein IFU33_22795 (plasmid) [Pantoea agglomerans]|uniref:hypothetical protein n=1 Tax=Enterobacter agglomerans TaxID=549 RepID=UPI0017844946|nr:hypothetical protein [Pantoea agglomerans]WLO87344.1 hypothetical protein NHB29_23100 [Pantoea agglomerans]WVJ49101.1 hypothetical protein IFU33_22795 [Pantoea agglomerans]
MDMQGYSTLAAVVGALTGIGSLIVSLYSLNRASKATGLAQTANDISSIALSNAQDAFRNVQGDSELAIHEAITTALNRMEDCSVKLATAKSQQNSDLTEINQTLLETAIQNLLNAYDIACQRYLDNKLDQKRFVQTYQRRLQELFDENKPYKTFIKDSSSTKYHALHTVHARINNPEINSR